jgi:hypothetical protein
MEWGRPASGPVLLEGTDHVFIQRRKWSKDEGDTQQGYKKELKSIAFEEVEEIQAQQPDRSDAAVETSGTDII